MRTNEWKDLGILFLIALAMVIFLAYADLPSMVPEKVEAETIESTWEPIPEEPEAEPMRVEIVEVETEETEYTEEDFYDDLELLAYCTMAEAGNQCEEGKRLVIDCILNRVDSEYFPGTIREVIFQKNPTQFAVTTDGSLYKNEPTEDIYRFIREEIHERTNNEVFYFNSIGFNTDGEAWRKVGAHYFSKLRKELQE